MPADLKKADQYYENEAERLAVKRLLAGKHFHKAADVGGGYGRMSILLEHYADTVILAEPSRRQLDISKAFLKDHPKIVRKLTQADSLDFKDGELDLVVFIRVLHHLPEPTIEFQELARVLSDEGYLVLEVANYTHARNRLKHLLNGQPLPKEPVDIRTRKGENVIPFVNHNPRTVITQLAHAGLKVEKTLSVSNLRSAGLKKIMPRGLMLAIERVMQPALAKVYFGPSTFFLIRKAK